MKKSFSRLARCSASPPAPSFFWRRISLTGFCLDYRHCFQTNLLYPFWLPPTHIHTVQRLRLHISLSFHWFKPFKGFPKLLGSRRYCPTWLMRPHMDWPLPTSPFSFHCWLPFISLHWSNGLPLAGGMLPPGCVEPLNILFAQPHEAFPTLFPHYSPLPSYLSSADTSQSLLRPSRPRQTWIMCSHSITDPRTCTPATAAMFRLFLCLCELYGGQGTVFGLAPCVDLVPRRVLGTQ